MTKPVKREPLVLGLGEARAVNKTLCSNLWVSFWTYGSRRSDAYLTLTADVERVENTLKLTNVAWTMSITGSMQWSGGTSPVKTCTVRYAYNGSWYDIGYIQWQMPTHTTPLSYSGTLSNTNLNIISPTTSSISFNAEIEDGPQAFTFSGIPHWVKPTDPYIICETLGSTQLKLRCGVTTRAYYDEWGTKLYEPDITFTLKQDNVQIDTQTLNSLFARKTATSLTPNTEYAFTAITDVTQEGWSDLSELSTNFTDNFTTSATSPYFGKIIYSDGTTKDITNIRVITTADTKNVAKLKVI